MSSAGRRTTVLVVDDDQVLLQVLNRVLKRAGYDVLPVASATEAREKVTQRPDLGLIDLALPDGNGVELAQGLHAEFPGLPLILMTAYPPRPGDYPGLDKEFARVLTKPVNLGDLQQVLPEVLKDGPRLKALPAATAESIPVATPGAAHPHRPLPVARETPRRPSRLKAVRSAGLLVLIVAILVLVIAFVAGVPIPGLASTYEDKTELPPPPLAVDLIKGKPHTLHVPEETRIALGIRKGKEDVFAIAKKPTAMQPLVLSGSTALDPTRLMRIRVRFTPAEVVRIGQTAEPPSRTASGQTEFR